MLLLQRVNRERYGGWNRLCQKLGVPPDAWLKPYKMRNENSPYDGEVCFLLPGGSQSWWSLCYFNKKVDTSFLERPLEDFL